MKTNILLITILLSLTGCSVKKTDTPAQKVLKHTANSPFYVAAGVVTTAKLALGLAISPIFIIKNMSDDNSSSEEQNVSTDDINQTYTYDFTKENNK